MNVRINYAAVVVSAVLYFALGAAWFTALSKPWAEGAGFTPEQITAAKPQPLPFIGAFIANLVLAYVLAWLVARTGETSAARGAKLGALLWVGLVATTMGTEIAFELRSLQFFLITAGYPLVGLLLMGAIVGGWRKKAA
jgi:hypothetical protein